MLLLSCTQEKIENFQQHSSILGIAEQEKLRTAQFTSLVGYGVIEFSWEDDRGKHREQGDFDFWKTGHSISLRVTKVGELIVWAGSSNGDSWMFDFTGEKSTLRLNDARSLFADALLALQLIGLEPIPVTTQGWESGWIVEFQQAMPTSITKEQEDGIWRATLREPIGVELQETHELHWPKTPSNIDLSSSVNDVELKIVFAGLSTIVDDEPMHRVFDLEYLNEKLQPDVIERITPSP